MNELLYASVCVRVFHTYYNITVEGGLLVVRTHVNMLPPTNLTFSSLSSSLSRGKNYTLCRVYDSREPDEKSESDCCYYHRRKWCADDARVFSSDLGVSRRCPAWHTKFLRCSVSSLPTLWIEFGSKKKRTTIHYTVSKKRIKRTFKWEKCVCIPFETDE